MARRRKPYGKWAMITWAISYFFVLLSFIGWVIDWHALFRIPQIIAAFFGALTLFFAFMLNHQLKMEVIDEIVTNVRARKKVIQIIPSEQNED